MKKLLLKEMNEGEWDLEEVETTSLAMGESWGIGLGELTEEWSVMMESGFLRWKRDFKELWWLRRIVSHIPNLTPPLVVVGVVVSSSISSTNWFSSIDFVFMIANRRQLYFLSSHSLIEIFHAPYLSCFSQLISSFHVIFPYKLFIPVKSSPSFIFDK